MAGGLVFALATCDQEDGGTLVTLAGELDHHRVPALAAAPRRATGRVVVDVRGVSFLDSATVTLLMDEHRRLREAGHELIVLVGEQTPKTAFAGTGSDRVLTIRAAD